MLDHPAPHAVTPYVLVPPNRRKPSSYHMASYRVNTGGPHTGTGPPGFLQIQGGIDLGKHR